MALVAIHSSVSAQVAKVRLHDVLALGIAVVREGSALGSAKASSVGAQEQRSK
jgi:hypothetical protein